MPDRALVGVAVADTIHLLAELVDNATAFSSPRSRGDRSTRSAVPHGIVVEIEDHGLGMTQEERLQANAMLSNPPDFETMALRGESRLGLFVVARLAARRGIKVELRDSPYGGTVALCVLPPNIVAPHSTRRRHHRDHADAGADRSTSSVPRPRATDHPSFPVQVESRSAGPALNAEAERRSVRTWTHEPSARQAVSATESIGGRKPTHRGTVPAEGRTKAPASPQADGSRTSRRS